MKIKDFEPGQTAYILRMHVGRNQDPEIIETSVEKVGRKYVTVRYGSRYEEDIDNPYGLIESADFGERSFLCPSRTDAEMYIERHKLQIWLWNIGNRHGKYTLEQLRRVKEILEEPQT